MAWFSLIAAGLCEMLGVAMINKMHREGTWLAKVLMVVSFGISFLFLALAMRQLSMGLSYAIWTGIGASGGAILGMAFYGESRDWRRLLFISMIIGATIGLKLVE